MSHRSSQHYPLVIPLPHQQLPHLQRVQHLRSVHPSEDLSIRCQLLCFHSAVTIFIHHGWVSETAGTRLCQVHHPFPVCGLVSWKRHLLFCMSQIRLRFQSELHLVHSLFLLLSVVVELLLLFIRFSQCEPLATLFQRGAGTCTRDRLSLVWVIDGDNLCSVMTSRIWHFIPRVDIASPPSLILLTIIFILNPVLFDIREQRFTSNKLLPIRL